MRFGPYLGAYVVGLLNAVQSRMNGGLAAAWHNPLLASVYSFGTGLLLLSVIALSVPPVRSAVRRIPAALRTHRLRWWELVGGLCGGTFVIAQSATVPVVGVAAFTIGVVAGQSTNSLVVDRAGLGPRGVIRATPQRVVAAALAVVAVAVAVSGRSSNPDGIPVAAVFVAFTAGLLVAVQQALNGRVTQESGSALSATWINFLLGTVMLMIALSVSVLVRGVALDHTVTPDWWLYGGGLVGLIFIALAAWAVPRIGVLMTALLAVAGQMTSSLLLDILLPTAGTQMSVGLVLGVVLAFAAVSIGARGRMRT